MWGFTGINTHISYNFCIFTIHLPKLLAERLKMIRMLLNKGFRAAESITTKT